MKKGLQNAYLVFSGITMFILTTTYLLNWHELSPAIYNLSLLERYIFDSLPLSLMIFSFINIGWVAKQHFQNLIAESADDLIEFYQTESEESF